MGVLAAVWPADPVPNGPVMLSGVGGGRDHSNGIYYYAGSGSTCRYDNLPVWRMFPDKQKTNGVQREFRIQMIGSTISLLIELRSGNQYAWHCVAISEKN